MLEHYENLACAYVRGVLSALPPDMPAEEVLARGRAAGLKLHRFKKTMGLPRVRAVIGMLRGLSPESLLESGPAAASFSGRRLMRSLIYRSPPSNRTNTVSAILMPSGGAASSACRASQNPLAPGSTQMATFPHVIIRATGDSPRVVSSGS